MEDGPEYNLEENQEKKMIWYIKDIKDICM